MDIPETIDFIVFAYEILGINIEHDPFIVDLPIQHGDVPVPKNMAMENGPYIGDFLSKPPFLGDFPLPCLITRRYQPTYSTSFPVSVFIHVAEASLFSASRDSTGTAALCDRRACREDLSMNTPCYKE